MTQPLLIASALIVGTAGTGAVVLSSTNLVGDGEPKYFALREDTDFDRSLDYFGTGFVSFGKKYKWYMVGQSRANRRWWNRALSRMEGNAPREFKAANRGWWYWGDDSLNRICRSKYIRYYGEVEKLGDENVWKYCSFLMKKPSLVKKGEYGGKMAGNELAGQIISTKDVENDLFWEIRNEEFFHELGRIAVLKKGTHAFFESLFNRKNKTIRERCEEAYSREFSNGKTKDKAGREEILRYCSFSGE